MAKVAFPFSVKHGGRFHGSHEPFEVNDSELDKLVAMGAKILEKSPKALESQPESKITVPASKQTKPKAATSLKRK